MAYVLVLLMLSASATARTYTWATVGKPAWLLTPQRAWAPPETPHNAILAEETGMHIARRQMLWHAFEYVYVCSPT